jgi:hypothetical protein
MHDVPFHVWLDREQQHKLLVLLAPYRSKQLGKVSDAEAFRLFLEHTYYVMVVAPKVPKAQDPEEEEEE